MSGYRRALVSVSEKTGLAEVLRPWVERGLQIVSSGGTAKYLRENKISVIDVAEQTGFSEVLGGRVKTLHPRIHMALLSRDDSDSDRTEMKAQNLDPFDLMIVNLYPFEEAKKSQSEDLEAMIEEIDIGGVALLRAAAKNFSRITVIHDASDYELLKNPEACDLATRRKLAAKAFQATSFYDALISDYLGRDDANVWTEPMRQHSVLRYGENPEQKAAWWVNPTASSGLHEAEVLQGKALSYNNLLDLDAAVNGVGLFEHPTAVAVKHNNPCGIGSGSNLRQALERALAADPVSVFGGIIAVNQSIGASEAELLRELFLECVVAPEYTAEAKSILSSKKNLRLLQWPQMKNFKAQRERRQIAGGWVEQTPLQVTTANSDWKFFGERPSKERLSQIAFGLRACALLKSNAIAIVDREQTLGLGMGQVNRVDAVAQAVERWRKHHASASDPVLVSDAFFPFADSIEAIHAAGIKWVVQPGGSVRDSDVIGAVESYKMNMVLTGQRLFRH